MFSWFLRLLGINEDRPTASKSSLLSATEAQQQAKQKPKASPKVETKPTVSEKTTKAPTPKNPPPKKKKLSLGDTYPDLKANIIKVLSSAGFDSKKAIDKASDKELLALKGVGKATIKVLRK